MEQRYKVNLGIFGWWDEKPSTPYQQAKRVLEEVVVLHGCDHLADKVDALLNKDGEKQYTVILI